MPKKLFLLASLLLATACSGGTGGSELRTLSNGETLPAECEICWVDFEACADSGVSIELCEQAVIRCAEICEAPLPPIQCDHCFVGYEACVDQAVEGMQDVGDCVAGLESCLGSCEDPNPCMPGDDHGPTSMDGLPGGECPPSSCEDVCNSNCYDDEPGMGGELPLPPPADACFDSCMMNCETPPEPPPEPCAELCWTCDAMDEDCKPGCDWVCEPPPEPCVTECWECPDDAEDCVSGCSTVCDPEPPPEPCTGTCEQVCDPAGECETVCWDDCDGGTEPPTPTPAD